VAITLLLLVVGLYLVHQLQTKVAVEDCLMAGRIQCDWLVQGRAVADVVEIRGGVISGLCNEPDSAVRRRGRLHHGAA